MGHVITPDAVRTWYDGMLIHEEARFRQVASMLSYSRSQQAERLLAELETILTVIRKELAMRRLQTVA